MVARRSADARRSRCRTASRSAARRSGAPCLRVAPEPVARALAAGSARILPDSSSSFPSRCRSPPAAAMPVSVDVQWPAERRNAAARRASDPCCTAPSTLDSDAMRPKLGRAAVTFGERRAGVQRCQAVNVGGSIEELDLDGWLELGAACKELEAAAAYFLLARSSSGPHRLSRPVVPRRHPRASQRTRAAGAFGPTDRTSRERSRCRVRQAPSDAWELEFERLKFVDAPRSRPTEADACGQACGRPAGNPTIRAASRRSRFHAAESIWGDRQFGEVRASLVKVDDGIRLNAADRDERASGRRTRRRMARQGAGQGPHRRHDHQHRRRGDLEAARVRRRDRGEEPDTWIST